MKKILILTIFLLFTTVDAKKMTVNLSYKNAKPCLTWEVDGSSKGYNYIVIKNDKKIAIIKPGFHFESSFTDESASEGDVYEIIMQNMSGKEIARSAKIVISLKPDLALNDQVDFSFSNIFPIVNEKVDFSIILRNKGAIAAKDFYFKVFDQNRKIIYKQYIKELSANKQKNINFSYKFPTKGVFELLFFADSEKKVSDSLLSNNSFKSIFRVDTKPFYIHWYGYVPKLKYVNLRQGNRADIRRFMKHGNYAGVSGGCNGLPPDKLLQNLRNLVNQGFNALYIDEICGDQSPTGVLLQVLPQLRKEYPNLFIAVWNINDEVSPRIAKQLKDGIINLLMLEIYIKPGENIKRIDNAAKKMRNLGIAEKVIIGLVTSKTWSGGASKDIYIKSLLNQIKRVHKVYPESPGIAFWDAIAPDGMHEAAEKLILKLYFK